MKRSLPFACVLALAIAACGKPPAVSPRDPPKPEPVAKALPSAPVGAVAEKIEPKAAESKTASSTGPEPTFHHDGFTYYGLDYKDPIDYELVDSRTKTRQTGSQAITLKQARADGATYEIHRTGGLAGLGDQTVEVTATGVRTISSSLGPLTGDSLELPAQLPSGAHWRSKNTLTTQDGRKLENDNTFKVVGTEKLKTKAGTYQALLITSTGTATIDGAKKVMKSKSWFVKGRGNVKLIISLTGGDGKEQTLTIEEAAPAKG
ncbi:MAG: hypothetical protein HYR64_04065 [Fimbriimonas ginsengisoli]|uniref:Lipoprotein n=1 Tax=Fimbriimonas ginsengisoli TaxID=1005039 RepID=A0A931LZT6_FIMGI|nr:hypothetical protein [Fimbriimonas ginsengisoli]